MSIKIPLSSFNEEMSTIDIAKVLADDKRRFVLVRSWRYAIEDGMGSAVIVLTNDNLFDILEDKITGFRLYHISHGEGITDLSLFGGFNDAEMTFKFFNVPKSKFRELLGKYPDLEEI